MPENETNPFRVYASNRRIEAIGTAFDVRLRGSDVRVAVSEGKVVLALHDPAVAVPTTPNDAPVEELLGTLEDNFGLRIERLSPDHVVLSAAAEL